MPFSIPYLLSRRKLHMYVLSIQLDVVRSLPKSLQHLSIRFMAATLLGQDQWWTLIYGDSSFDFLLYWLLLAGRPSVTKIYVSIIPRDKTSSAMRNLQVDVSVSTSEINV